MHSTSKLGFLVAGATPNRTKPTSLPHTSNKSELGQPHAPGQASANNSNLEPAFSDDESSQPEAAAVVEEQRNGGVRLDPDAVQEGAVTSSDASGPTSSAATPSKETSSREDVAGRDRVTALHASF